MESSGDSEITVKQESRVLVLMQSNPEALYVKESVTVQNFAVSDMLTGGKITNVECAMLAP